MNNLRTCWNCFEKCSIYDEVCPSCDAFRNSRKGFVTVNTKADKLTDTKTELLTDEYMPWLREKIDVLIDKCQQEDLSRDEYLEWLRQEIDATGDHYLTCRLKIEESRNNENHH